MDVGARKFSICEQNLKNFTYEDIALVSDKCYSFVQDNNETTKGPHMKRFGLFVIILSTLGILNSCKERLQDAGLTQTAHAGGATKASIRVDLDCKASLKSNAGSVIEFKNDSGSPSQFNIPKNDGDLATEGAWFQVRTGDILFMAQMLDEPIRDTLSVKLMKGKYRPTFEIGKPNLQLEIGEASRMGGSRNIEVPDTMNGATPYKFNFDCTLLRL